MSDVDVLEAVRAVDEAVISQDGLGLRYLQAGRVKEDGVRLWVTTPLGYTFYYAMPRSLNEVAESLRPDALAMVSTRDRIEALAEAADAVDDMRDQLARLISVETGKELGASREEVEAASWVLRNAERAAEGRPSSGRGMLLFPSSSRSWTSVTIASARGIGLV
ncbi:MAG: aldehyde dehydrogenase family protein, partial [Acidilobus sp.]